MGTVISRGGYGAEAATSTCLSAPLRACACAARVRGRPVKISQVLCGAGLGQQPTPLRNDEHDDCCLPSRGGTTRTSAATALKFSSSDRGRGRATRRDETTGSNATEASTAKGRMSPMVAWHTSYSSRWFLYVLYGLLNTYGTNVTKWTGFFLLLFFSNGEILRIIQGKFCK